MRGFKAPESNQRVIIQLFSAGGVMVLMEAPHRYSEIIVDSSATFEWINLPL